MKNIPNFSAEIQGLTGEIFVSDNEGGKFMCVFVNNGVTDFTSIYNAYGFMVWTLTQSNPEIQFFPIKLQEQTKLTKNIMSKMWDQISYQISERLLDK